MTSAIEILKFIRSHLNSAMTIDRGRSGATTLIVGCGRSGTSWLGRVIAHDKNAREIFEPFEPRRLQQVEAYGRREYIRSDASRPDIADMFATVFGGGIKSVWTDGQSSPGLFKQRVVKEIRVCLALGWLANEFPQLPIIFIIRNPFANAMSRIKLGWRSDYWAMNPDELLKDYPELFGLFESLQHDLARHIMIWASDNLVALSQLQPGRADVVFYEDLVAANSDSLQALRERQTPGVTALPSRHQPRSLQGKDMSRVAEEKFGTEAVAESVRVLQAFGLHELYNPDPNHEALGYIIGSRIFPKLQ